MLLDIFANIIAAAFFKTFSMMYAIFIPLAVMINMFIVTGIVLVVMRLLPKKLWNPNLKYFKVSKKEVRFLEKLGVKKWKDQIPEWGATGGFSKRHMQATDEQYLLRFIYETCFGEILHLLSAIFGFMSLLYFKADQYYFFVLPIAITNFVLQLMPCLVQRYNRYRLTLVLNRKQKQNAI